MLAVTPSEFGKNFYEGYQVIKYGAAIFRPQLAEDLNHLLLTINSSVNIIIFTARYTKFRIALLGYFSSSCLHESYENSLTIQLDDIEENRWA